MLHLASLSRPTLPIDSHINRSITYLKKKKKRPTYHLSYHLLLFGISPQQPKRLFEAQTFVGVGRPGFRCGLLKTGKFKSFPEEEIRAWRRGYSWRDQNIPGGIWHLLSDYNTADIFQGLRGNNDCQLRTIPKAQIWF